MAYANTCVYTCLYIGSIIETYVSILATLFDDNELGINDENVAYIDANITNVLYAKVKPHRDVERVVSSSSMTILYVTFAHHAQLYAVDHLSCVRLLHSH